MALPPLVRRCADEVLAGYCAQRIPVSMREHVRLEHRVRGMTITLVERRPPWKGQGDETTSPVAQLRYDSALGGWALYCRARERWWPYDLAEPTADLNELLDAIDQDETGIFWG